MQLSSRSLRLYVEGTARWLKSLDRNLKTLDLSDGHALHLPPKMNSVLCYWSSDSQQSLDLLTSEKILFIANFPSNLYHNPRQNQSV